MRELVIWLVSWGVRSLVLHQDARNGQDTERHLDGLT